MYGAQTGYCFIYQTNGFENDVEMYGAQTLLRIMPPTLSLRMM